MNDDLIKRIENAARRLNLSPSTLCRQAVNDGKLIERLRNGSSVTLRTVAKLDEWLAANVPTDEQEAPHAA